MRIIADRFLEGMDYVAGSQEVREASQIVSFEKPSGNVIDLMKLKYALSPAEEKDIESSI